MKSIIEKQGKFNEELAIQILRHIVNGLLDLFKKRIIHRDLKPDNILLNNGVVFFIIKYLLIGS